MLKHAPARQVRRMGVCFVVGLCITLASALTTADDFVLREHLGRTWTNELVTFSLTPDQLAAVRKGARLIGPGEMPLSCQLSDLSDQPRIAFQVTLTPGATQTYRLEKATGPTASDLRIEDSAQTLRIGNAHIGIALRKTLKASRSTTEARLRHLGSGHSARFDSVNRFWRAQSPPHRLILAHSRSVDRGRYVLSGIYTVKDLCCDTCSESVFPPLLA